MACSAQHSPSSAPAPRAIFTGTDRQYGSSGFDQQTGLEHEQGSQQTGLQTATYLRPTQLDDPGEPHSRPTQHQGGLCQVGMECQQGILPATDKDTESGFVHRSLVGRTRRTLSPRPQRTAVNHLALTSRSLSPLPYLVF